MRQRHFLLRMLQGASWFFAARLGSAVALLAINAVLARFLALDELGIYVLYLSIVTIIGTVAGAGFGSTCTKMVAEGMRLGRFRQVRQATLAGLLVSSSVSVLLALLCFGWPVPLLLEGAFGRPVGGLEALCAGIWLVTLAVRNTGGFVYRGLQVMSLAALYQGAGGNFVVALLLAVLYFALGEGGVLVTLAVMAAAGLVTVTSCWLGILTRLRRLPVETDGAPEPFPWRAFLRRGGLLSLPTLFQTNGREVCVWIVGATAGLGDVALFGTANRLMQVVAIPVVVTNQVLQPFIAEFQAAGDLERKVRSLRLSTAVVFVVMLGMVGVIALFGHQILALLFTPELAAAYPILLWLALGRLIQAFFGPAFAVLSMTGHEAMLARDSLLQFLMLAGFGLLGGYLGGGIGVAVVFCLTLASFAVYRTLTVQRRLGLWLMPELDPVAMVGLVRTALGRRKAKAGRGAKGERAADPVDAELLP